MGDIKLYLMTDVSKRIIRKPQHNIGNKDSLKEWLHQNQSISELLRIIIARQEDVQSLKQMIQKKYDKLKIQTKLAEKMVQEIQYKEDWREGKEDEILNSISFIRMENDSQKKFL